jgi:hypothetical protein
MTQKDEACPESQIYHLTQPSCHNSTPWTGWLASKIKVLTDSVLVMDSFLAGRKGGGERETETERERERERE